MYHLWKMYFYKLSALYPLKKQNTKVKTLQIENIKYKICIIFFKAERFL